MRVPAIRTCTALVAALLLCAGCATTSTGGDGKPLSPAQMKQQSSKAG